MTEQGDARDIILDIHDGVFRLPFEMFKDEILTLIKSVIPFDMAIWGSGVQEPQLIFSIATHEFPLAHLMDYSMRWQAHDALRSAVAAHPGMSMRNEDLGPIDDYHASEIYRGFCSPAGIEHALGCTTIDPITNVGELIFLFRGLKGAFFSDDERDAMTDLMPHLTLAWRHRQILQSRAQGKQGDELSAALPDCHAIIDDLGQVHASGPEFGWAMRACFPDWIGPRLPEALLPIVHGEGRRLILNGHHFAIARGLDRHILTIVDAVTELPISPAEHRVAIQYAEGKTAGAVAAALGISPLTVRNHLTSIYAKIGVHSKVALAKWLSTRR